MLGNGDMHYLAVFFSYLFAWIQSHKLQTFIFSYDFLVNFILSVTTSIGFVSGYLLEFFPYTKGVSSLIILD